MPKKQTNKKPVNKPKVTSKVIKEPEDFRCIHKINPAGGFARSHTKFCSYCEEDATHHASVETYWCGNVCKKCGEKNKRAYLVNTVVEVES